MGHFKIQLDQSVNHLEDMFPSKKVVTNETLGLPQHASDDEVVAEASAGGNLLITANRMHHDFENAIKSRVAQSSKKGNGCTRTSGLVLLFSNDELVQRRMLTRLEDRLIFEGKRINYQYVHSENLLVKVYSDGTTNISRLPKCRHCGI